MQTYALRYGFPQKCPVCQIQRTICTLEQIETVIKYKSKARLMYQCTDIQYILPLHILTTINCCQGVFLLFKSVFK